MRQASVRLPRKAAAPPAAGLSIKWAEEPPASTMGSGIACGVVCLPSAERYSLTAVPEALTISMLPPWPNWIDS